MAKVLNVSTVGATSTETRSAVEIARTLQRSMLQLKGKFMDDDGKGVNYGEMAASEDFAEYCGLAAQLVSVDVGVLSHEESLSFWINVYNALTIHALANLNGPEGIPSVLQVEKFWSTMAYNVGGETFTLDEIEHGILRGNKDHPTTKLPFFGEGDSRLRLVLKRLDPRIHFALVCGAKSCPPIRVFSPENIDSGLQRAAKSFISNEVEVNLAEHKVTMSKIFMWYGGDFGPTPTDVVRWCADCLDEGAKKTELLAFLSEQEKEFAYSEYDWRLNATSKA